MRSVLRAVLAADGLSVVFGPGVQGRVSANFRGTPLQTVFDQLTHENGLSAEYNASTRTVTVGAADGAGSTHHFVTLQNVDWSSLRQMLISFGLGTDGVVYDPATSLLGVTGDAAHVAQVEDLVRTLEQHYNEHQERSLTDTQRSANTQRSDYERRAYDDAMNVQTKVFRLRFADVGPTTRNFHGRTVTIPGILETLQAMLGTNTPAAPLAAQAGPASGFLPAIGTGTGPRAAAQATAEALTSAQRAPQTPALAIGRPNLSIDQRTNSVIVRGSPAAIAAVQDVLKQIDQPVKMVEIEVIIATAELGVVDQFGVSYRGSVGRGGVGFDTGSSGGVIPQQPGYNALSLLPTAASGSTVASFVLNGNSASLQAQLQALSQQNKARVLSAPHLVTLDNITARITRSEDIYVPVDTGGLNGQGLSQIQTGLTLEITPSIVPVSPGSSEQLVRSTLDATNSAPGSGTGSQINVNSQEVQTDVLVPDGGTFVVGGLFDDSRLKVVSGSSVPLFSERAGQSDPSLNLTVRAPDWDVGSQWQYNDGYGLQVSRRDGPLTTFERLDDPRQWVVRRGFLREDAQSGSTLRKVMFEDMPSGAGMVLSSASPLTYRREYAANGTERAHVTSWTVERRETVKVPAGTFDCEVLVMRTRNTADGWTGFERWWFSPQVQNFVRMEYRYGDTSSGSRVLVRYQLGQGAANTALRRN